jgi:uncharacterized protein
MDARRTASRLAAGAAVAALVVAVFWSVAVEPARVVVRRTEVAVPSWPPALAGFSVVVLADIHAGAPHMGIEQVRRVVALANAQHPDLVVLPGDYVIQDVVGGRFVPPEVTAAVLGGLRARDGVVSVLGNHDGWLDGPRVHRALERAGLRPLVNESLRIEDRGREIWIAGLADLWTGRPDLSRALASVPADALVIVLTHNPDVFPTVPARVNLTLAGHTHGGQVALPLIGRPIVPSRYGQRYAIGVVREQGRVLFVSPGLGTSILPVRFRVPPEVSVLSLVPGPPP